MKKFIGNIVFWAVVGSFLVAVVVGILLSTIYTFIDIKNFAVNLGGGSLVRGLILLPFFVIGCIYVVRVFFAIGEKDGDAIDFKHKWQESIYCAIILLSYVAFVIGIGELL